MLHHSLSHIFYLFISVFDRLAADGTFGILEELSLAAPFALAVYHNISAADVTFFTSCENISAAKRALRHERSAAAGADAVATSDIL